jgi:formyltetrahydrofolate deformylase
MTNTNSKSSSAILLIHCEDKKGLVAIVTDFIYKNHGNIIYLDQHVDNQQKVFFMRVEWELEGFSIPSGVGASFFRGKIQDGGVRLKTSTLPL